MFRYAGTGNSKILHQESEESQVMMTKEIGSPNSKIFLSFYLPKHVLRSALGMLHFRNEK
jgi:hypothetical protein